MAKCDGCNGTILVGGTSFKSYRFCGDPCATRFKGRVAEESLGRAMVDQAIAEAFQSKCPECAAEATLDLYSVPKVTSYILVFTMTTDRYICCASCARKHRLGAGVHTMFLGIWGPRGLVFSLFVAPYNLVRGAFTFAPSKPSGAFAAAVKGRLGEQVIRQKHVEDVRKTREERK